MPGAWGVRGGGARRLGGEGWGGSSGGASCGAFGGYCCAGDIRRLCLLTLLPHARALAWYLAGLPPLCCAASLLNPLRVPRPDVQPLSCVVLRCADILLGYHSEEGWTATLRLFSGHYGLEAEVRRPGGAGSE